VVNENNSVFALKKVKLDDLDSFMIECNMNEIKLLLRLKGNPFIIQLYDWYVNTYFGIRIAS
jgi:Protein kinase domain.